MNPVYFQTRFRVGFPLPDLPREFAIITAWATTGEVWTPAHNLAANRHLEAILANRGVWYVPLEGYSPASGHAEPGWAAELAFDDACNLGLQFLQDAIYFVRDDALLVSRCDRQCAPVYVGRFRERLEPEA